jgi:hypothetical protein
LYGLEAISTHNGWAMAGAGIIIVFLGLVALSATIAQFHKVLNFLDDRAASQNDKGLQKASGAEGFLASDPLMMQNLAVSARQFRLISNQIGEPFSLPKLLGLAELSGLSHPHSTINNLLKAGWIVPDGKGCFLWKQ